MKETDCTAPLPCEEALDLLEPSLDGELAPGEESRLRSHLTGCHACAAELALAVRIQKELRALRPAVVLPFPPQRRVARPARRLAAAAMLVVTIGGGLYLGQVRTRPAASPSPEEIARATAEARFALAYVGRVSRHTGLDLRNGILHRRMPLATEEPGKESL
jgi:anti-sigma factor RsiW